MTKSPDPPKNLIQTTEYFTSLTHLSSWLERNCQRCRYTTQDAPFLEPPRPCKTAPTLLTLFITERPIPKFILRILDPNATKPPPQTYNQPPHKCQHFTDKRGRKRSR